MGLLPSAAAVVLGLAGFLAAGCGGAAGTTADPGDVGGSPGAPPVVPPIVPPPPPPPVPPPPPPGPPVPETPPGAFAVTAAVPHCAAGDLTGPAVLLMWSAAHGAESYVVVRDGAPLDRTFGPAETFLDDVGLPEAGRSYSYVVRATNSAGSTEAPLVFADVPFDVCVAKVPPPPPPTEPAERLVNGSFDIGDAGWVLVGDAWIGADPLEALTPPGYAAVGVDEFGVAKDVADGSFAQVVAIPFDATVARLSFAFEVTTAEVAIDARDVMEVTIEDPDGTRLETVLVLSNLDAGFGYSLATFDLVTDLYRGRTVHVRFHAMSDAADPTAFRVDDVSLMTDGY